LKRPGRPAEPSVVGHVHHEACTVPHEATHQCRKDSLVTDHGPKGGWRTREDHAAGAGLEVRDELGPAPHEADHARERHVLTKWNKLNLIISVHDASFVQQNCTVTIPGRGGSLSV